MIDMAKRKTEISSTVLRALEILEYLKDNIGPQSVTEIANNLGFSTTIVHRLLATLKMQGFVFQDTQTRLYSLGTIFIEYANKLTTELPFASIIEPELLTLRNQTEETVGFYILNGYKRVCVLEYESRLEIRRSVGVGTIYPAYSGATGRSLISFLSSAIQQDYMKEIEGEELEAFKEKVKETKQQGYAISYEEINENVTALSAPVFDQHDRLIGAISISGPMFRFQKEQIEKYVPLLLASTNRIKKVLGE